MPRFLPEYKELDVRPAWEKVTMTVTLILLFLLVPTMVLGYMSESSLPGQPLYPLKRGIESMTLLVESLTPYKKSQYYQTLATKRVDEANALVAQAEASGDFSQNDLAASDLALNDVVVSVQQAAKETQTISNPVQRQQAQQQLASSIKNYQTQLTQIHYTIQSHLITPTPAPTSLTQTTQDTPTPTSTQNTQSAADLQNQINDTQNALNDINSTLQSTPSPTLMPTNTPTIIPSPTLTPSPTPKNSHHNGDNFFHFWGN